MDGGIPPSRMFVLFVLRTRKYSMDNEPISSGILPTRRLLPKLRTWRLEQFVMADGIRKRRPISGGISPENELLKRLISLRKLRFPMEGDNVPVKPPDERSKRVTLWRRGLQVTPSHWQKLVLESFHEVMTPCGPSLIMDLMASNAMRSLMASLLFCAVVVWMSIQNTAKCTRTARRNDGAKQNPFAPIFNSEQLNQVRYTSNLLQVHMII
ncbi:hypothetical protein Hanom_Chr07g00665801 [Helianthus anomalus]